MRPAAAYFEPLEAPPSKDVESPFIKLKLGRIFTLTMLSFVQIRKADFDLQLFISKNLALFRPDRKKTYAVKAE